MTPTFQTPNPRLFALLRAALFDEPLDEPSFAACTLAEWEQLFYQSVAQQVSALTWDGIGHLPEEVWPKRPTGRFWRSEYQRTIDSSQHKSMVTRKLIAFFAEHGIQTYPLKGVRISACYPKPALRRFNDIDIFQRDDWQRADQLVRDQLGVEISQVKHHHTIYTYEHETIENHYHLLNHYKYRSNIRYEREMMAYFGTPTFDALFLLRHTAAHFAVDRIMLRHLCDWAMYVRRHEGDVDWAVVSSFSRRYNMDRFLAALMGLIEEYLHYTFSSLPAGVDKDVQHRVMSDILSPHVTRNRLVQFFRNRWKFRITFTDSLLSAFFSRLLSIVTHRE